MLNLILFTPNNILKLLLSGERGDSPLFIMLIEFTTNHTCVLLLFRSLILVCTQCGTKDGNGREQASRYKFVFNLNCFDTNDYSFSTCFTDHHFLLHFNFNQPQKPLPVFHSFIELLNSAYFLSSSLPPSFSLSACL